MEYKNIIIELLELQKQMCKCSKSLEDLASQLNDKVFLEHSKQLMSASDVCIESWITALKVMENIKK